MINVGETVHIDIAGEVEVLEILEDTDDDLVFLVLTNDGDEVVATLDDLREP